MSDEAVGSVEGLGESGSFVVVGEWGTAVGGGTLGVGDGVFGDLKSLVEIVFIAGSGEHPNIYNELIFDDAI